jgi:hypothetical protein
MEELLGKIEDALEPLFTGLPALPKNVKEWFVKAWPILALILGVLQLLAAWSLWNVGHLVNNLANYANQLSNVYGTGVAVNQLSFFYWFSLIVLVVDAVILLIAYTGLKARSRKGWNMLFLGVLVNVVFGVITAFDGGYGGFGNLIMALIDSAIAFYFLFQVRSYYTITTKSTTKSAEL